MPKKQKNAKAKEAFGIQVVALQRPKPPQSVEQDPKSVDQAPQSVEQNAKTNKTTPDEKHPPLKQEAEVKSGSSDGQATDSAIGKKIFARAPWGGRVEVEVCSVYFDNAGVKWIEYRPLAVREGWQWAMGVSRVSLHNLE